MGVFGNQQKIAKQQAGTFELSSDAMFESTWTELKNAAIESTFVEGLTNSEGLAYNQEVMMGVNMAGLDYDQEIARARLDYIGVNGNDFGFSPRDLYVEMENQIVKAGGPSLDEIDGVVRERIKTSREGSHSAAQRSDGSSAWELSANVFGGMKASLYDPITWGTLPIGAIYKGGSLLLYSGKEGLIQTGVGGSIGAATYAMNKDYLNELGFESKEMWDEVVATATPQGLLGIVTGLAQGGLRMRGANKAITELEEANMTGVGADKAADKVRQYLSEGYKFDSGQDAVINKYFKEVEDGSNLGSGRDSEETDHIGGALEETQQKANGEPTDGKASQALDEEVPANYKVDWGENTPTKKRIDALEKEIAGLQAKKGKEGVARSVKKKRNKKIKDLEVEVESLKKQIESKETDADAMLRSAVEELDSLKAEVDGQGAVVRSRKNDVKQADREFRALGKKLAKKKQKTNELAGETKKTKKEASKDSIRNPEARKKYLKKAEYDIAQLEKRVADARARLEGARAKLAESEKALDDLSVQKDGLDRVMNGLHNTQKGVDAINRTGYGLTRKVKKTDKGKPKPEGDTVEPSSRGTEEATPVEREMPENGTMDEVGEKARTDKADDILDRTTDKGKSPIMVEQRRSVVRTRSNKKAMEDAMNCFIGGK